MTRSARARAMGLNPSTVAVRIHRGWGEDLALSHYQRERIDPMKTQRERRQSRYEAGDCVSCGREPRDGDGVLGPGCRQKNNLRRRKDTHVIA